MRRTITMLAAAALVAVGAMGAKAQDAEKVVNVYNWSDYIDPQILKDFTKETGIKVVYDVYDSNDILDTKLFAGGSGYDVVVPSSEYLVRQIAAGLIKKLDKSKLTNLDNMWDVIRDRVGEYKDVNDYSINYMWGTTGIGYNTKMVEERLGKDAPTDSWALIFDPQYASKLADCGIMMLDAPTEVIPAALNYLGHRSRHSTNPDDIKKAEDMLLKVRPLRPQVPLVRIHQRARQRRHLRRLRLFRRHLPGPRPRRRGQAGRRDRLFDPQGGRPHVVRPDGDPGRRAAS